LAGIEREHYSTGGAPTAQSLGLNRNQLKAGIYLYGGAAGSKCGGMYFHLRVYWSSSRNRIFPLAQQPYYLRGWICSLVADRSHR